MATCGRVGASARRRVAASLTTGSETTLGVIFLPQVVAMIHLYN
ncbi:MAG TPA: hypothetical protein VFV99_12520 [Kofleriaceae bacterium]|nr:hypothetical protein [Kofleriaceae bacterium]